MFVVRLVLFLLFIFFCQAEDGIRDLVRSRGLGDVYKRQVEYTRAIASSGSEFHDGVEFSPPFFKEGKGWCITLSLIHI